MSWLRSVPARLATTIGLALTCLVGAQADQTTVVRLRTIAAPASGPNASLPLLDPSTDMTYAGAFRLPTEFDSIADQVKSIHITEGNSASNLLVQVEGYLFEITIPSLSTSSTWSALPRATMVQSPANFYTPAFADAGSPSQGFSLGGLLRDGTDIIANFYAMYPNITLTKSFYRTSATSISASNYPAAADYVWDGDTAVSGLVSNWQAYFAAGITNIPTGWRSDLGGDALVSGPNNCASIVSRLSNGPSAGAITRATFGSGAAATSASPRDVTALLYYPPGHWTLGEYSAQDDDWGAVACASTGVIFDNMRTALYCGSNGSPFSLTGREYVYGPATSDPLLHGTPAPGGFQYGYDLIQGNEGPHAYPYRPFCWAYNLNDFVAVKAGTLMPWEPVPYWSGAITIPLASNYIINLMGGYYKPSTKQYFVGELKVGGFENGQPAILVWTINDHQ